MTVIGSRFTQETPANKYMPTYKGVDLGSTIQTNNVRDEKEQKQAIKHAYTAYQNGNKDLAQKYLTVATKYAYFNEVACSDAICCDIVFDNQITALAKTVTQDAAFHKFLGTLRNENQENDNANVIRNLCSGIKLGLPLLSNGTTEEPVVKNCGSDNADPTTPPTSPPTTPPTSPPTKPPKNNTGRILGAIGGALGGMALLSLLSNRNSSANMPTQQQYVQSINIPQYQQSYIPGYPPSHYHCLPSHSGCMTDMPICPPYDCQSLTCC